MLYPEGAIPRVEPHETHRAFIRAVQPAWAMLNIRDARRLVKRGETATSYFGAETSVIVTTTVSDEILDLLRWEDELEIIREFEPAYHIPADYSTYDADTPEIREKNIAECMEGTIWFEQQLRDSKTGIIPILKGTDPFERNICYRTFQEPNVGYVAYYVTQYFTGGDGIQIHQLVEDVTAIAEETDRDLLLIGLLSAGTLSRLPKTVVASAGLNGWRTTVEPRRADPMEMRHRYGRFERAIEDAIPGLSDESSTRSGRRPDGLD